jgi:hypothetical protein
MDNQSDSHDLVLVVEGERSPRQVRVPRTATAAEVVSFVVAETGRVELTEIFLEDEEDCLVEEHRVVEIVIEEFRLIHVGTKGKIKVTVSYNSRKVDREFAPSATMQKIIEWAISPRGLGLEGSAADYQLKLGTEILPPDAHLGQIAGGKKHVTLSLVFRVKPQGAS